MVLFLFLELVGILDVIIYWLNIFRLSDNIYIYTYTCTLCTYILSTYVCIIYIIYIYIFHIIAR